MLSRALITVITCSIIFSYAVLCPQAEGSYQFVSQGFYSVLDYEQTYDFLGKDIIPLLDFVPETYLYFNTRYYDYAYSYDSVAVTFNGKWVFSSFEPLSSIIPGTYNFSFVFGFLNSSYEYECTGVSYQVTGDNSVLYFIDNTGLYHPVYSNGVYENVYLYFDDTVISNSAIVAFIRSNFYCIDFPAAFNSMTYYPICANFSDYPTDFLNISFTLAFPVNTDPLYFNIYDFAIDDIYVFDSYLDFNSYRIVPYSVLSSGEYISTDSFSGLRYAYFSFDFVLDLSSFSDVENILAFFPLPTFDSEVVGYSDAAAFISPLTIESFSSVDQAFLNSINNVTNKLDQTNATLNNIQNTLTNVTPEMQQSLDSLETLMQDEAGKVEDVINGMDQIGTDFGTEIGDFDNILNENAGTLEDIGSTTYNSFINDVFGNWFFVSMFALFGAFAFFSRAVFG